MDYETAMKKAVEEADAAKEAASKKKRVSSSSRIPSLFDLRDMVVVRFSSLWKQKQGRIIIIAAGGLLVLLILISILSSLFSVPAGSSVSYTMSDAILCVYEDDDVKSGYAYDAYVEITNTGKSSIYAKDMSFMIQDEDGNRVMIDDAISVFPAIIAPGEKGYIFNRFGTELTGVYDPDMELYLVPSYSVEEADAALHEFPVDNVKVSEGDLGQKMTAQVTNDTQDEVKSMYVVGVCYNADGHCVGISGSFVENVEPHVSVNVSFDPMTMVRPWRNEQIVDYMIYAY